MVNTAIVANVIGVLLVLLGSFMFTSLFFSLCYESGDAVAIVKASLTTILIGALIWVWTRNASKKIGRKEGFLIVALGWLSVCAFGSLPYYLSGVTPEFTNAVFESVSGMTTTGATILKDIEVIPKGILFWRSLTQWLGGMGIIVLTVALFPLLGIGGVELFVAEAPGPTSDKIHPRIKETAKRLWLIYVGITIFLCPLLYFSGMSFYDAINHALTTMATGGFSTKNTSIAHFDSPLIEYIIIFFMLLSSINYSVIYFGLKGKLKKVWSSDELKIYIFVVIFLIVVIGSSMHQISNIPLEESFRMTAFQIISIITTTGFVTADYTSWAPVFTFLFFALFFVGGCAGSTSGGIKIIRHLVLFKNSFLELERLLHPKALIRVKIDNKIVSPRILTHILVFVILYMLLFFVGSITMAVILSDFEQPILSAMGAAASSLGNIGPSIAELGPTNTFYDVPHTGKWVLIFLMILGRLELFTILILLTPFYWKGN
ncbi:MAG: TrkH family potassium uptake protein [Saprospiraceae bacterium]